MQKHMYILLVILITWHVLYPDSCIKEKLHTDSYYNSGVVQPAEDSEREIWIGEKKLCTLRDNWKIILDMNQNVRNLLSHCC